MGHELETYVPTAGVTFIVSRQMQLMGSQSFGTNVTTVAIITEQLYPIPSDKEFDFRFSEGGPTWLKSAS
jgi:hypothetical protein